MDAFELAVDGGQPHGNVVRSDLSCRDLGTEAGHVGDPVGDPRGNLGMRRRLHPSPEGVEVVRAEVARRLLGDGVGVGRDLPDLGHEYPMNGSHLRQGDELPGRRVAGIDPLTVDPARGLGVSQDFHVVLEGLGADGSAFF
jgi:hypothetical protein